LVFRIKKEVKHMLKATERDMKDTGVTRRIDELGRIVIPREMRKTLRIRVGDPLEFYSDAEKIIIKKYSPLASLENSAKAVAQAIAETTQKSCVIVDKQKVVYTTDSKANELVERDISSDLENALLENISMVLSRADGGKVLPITNDCQTEIENQVIVPISFESDIFGAVILFDNDAEYRFTNKELDLVKLGANLLAKQFE
jgi:stage V sporulation protein T